MTSHEQDPLLPSSNPTVSSPPPSQVGGGQKEVCRDTATGWRRDSAFLQAQGPPSSRPGAASRAQGNSGRYAGTRSQGWWEKEAEISDAPGFSGPWNVPLPGTPHASLSHRCAGLQEGALGSWAQRGRGQGVAQGLLAPEIHRQCPRHSSGFTNRKWLSWVRGRLDQDLLVLESTSGGGGTESHRESRSPTVDSQQPSENTPWLGWAPSGSLAETRGRILGFASLAPKSHPLTSGLTWNDAKKAGLGLLSPEAELASGPEGKGGGVPSLLLPA